MTNDLPAPGAQASEQTHHGLLWHRYVAIGDSFTEGMSDHDPREDEELAAAAAPTDAAPCRP